MVLTLTSAWWRILARWALIAAALNAVWEIAHLPLYTLWQEPDRWRVAAYVAHCTVGDVIIAVVSYLLVATALRRFDWPWVRALSGTLLLVAVGVGYTVYSEWLNVYQRQAWAYAPNMPLIAGIGLSPLLQWLLLPPLAVAILRWRSRRP
jgi:hypothetical protein